MGIFCEFKRPDGLNWYVYCGNNPINFVDPLGLKAAPDGSNTPTIEHEGKTYGYHGEGEGSFSGWHEWDPGTEEGHQRGWKGDGNGDDPRKKSTTPEATPKKTPGNNDDISNTLNFWRKKIESGSTYDGSYWTDPDNTYHEKEKRSPAQFIKDLWAGDKIDEQLEEESVESLLNKYFIWEIISRVFPNHM